MNDKDFIRKMFGDKRVEEALLTNAAADLLDGKMFFCNPDKNKDCKKTVCYRNGGDCMLTKKKECGWQNGD